MDRCFAPEIADDARLLILGSLPGARSLAEQRYYAHPQNQFWRLVGTAIGRDLAAMNYPGRLDALRLAGIGLWDTVAEATRKGSLDADIRLHRPSEIGALAAGLPQLRAIAFNGGTAARIGRRQLGEQPPVALLDLPSSSPAHTMPFATKLEAWLRLRDFL